MTTHAPGQPWTLTLVAVPIAMVLAASHESIASMMALWQLSSYEHAWIVPLISVYLIWSRRHQIEALPPSPSVLGALALVVAAWTWVIARVTFVQALEHLSVWVMLNAAVWAVLGLKTYGRLMVPMAFLLLALPVGTSLVPLLMEATATIAGALLSAVGIPAYREGVFFTLPGGYFVVADVCSGYQYLNAGVTIAALFAVFMFRRLSRALLYIAACAVLFVLINGVRAAAVMAVASATDMQVFVGQDHVIFGWVLFLLGMVAIYALGLKIADPVAQGSAR